MTLTTHHLEFTATALTPLELDDQAGSSIRGAVVGGCGSAFAPTRPRPPAPIARSSRFARWLS